MKQLAHGFKEGVKEAIHAVRQATNFLLLAPTYLIGVGATSMAAKLTRKHFLDSRTKQQKTYWKELDMKKDKMEKYYRQF